MTELVAVRGADSLFASGDVGVIVDTKALDVYDPEPLADLLAQDGWVSAANIDKAMVASAHKDLAETQLLSYQPTDTSGRMFRVPKAVQAAASTGLQWRQDPTKPTGGTAYGVGIAHKLASGTITQDTVEQVHTFFTRNPDAATVVASAEPTTLMVAAALWGGSEGREWAGRIVTSMKPKPVVAAGAPVVSPDEEPQDPTQPHEFKVFAEGDTTCAFCDGPQEDPIHVQAEASAADPMREGSDEEPELKGFFAQVDPTSTGPTFVCLGLYALENGGWFVREDGDWIPTEAPEADSLALLDEESYDALLAQVDDPMTTTLELSISEERLTELALNELDLDLLDAVFAKMPYVDPQVRSQNASKQVRDSNGRFIQVGAKLKTPSGMDGTVTGTNADGTVDVQTANGTENVPAGSVSVEGGGESEAPTVKARLAVPGTIVPDVAARIAEYAQSAGGGAATPPDDAVLAAGEVPAPAAPAAPAPAPPAAPAAPAATPAAPGGSTAVPLYLAVVDSVDTQAVLDLVAVIPAEAGGGAVEAYKRDGGNWVPAADLLSDLQGATPPSVVELDEASLGDVISQMDASTVTASIHVFSLTAGGTIVRERVEAPAQFASYDELPLPIDVIQGLNELAEGGADQNRGNAERLRRYWTVGEGGAKIRWNTPGDWTRCEHELSKHLGERAKGYCALRHKEMTGKWTGEERRDENKFEVADSLSALVGELQGDGEAPITAPPTDTQVAQDPHDFTPNADDQAVCDVCGGPVDDPIHAAAPADSAPVDDGPVPVDATEPSAPMDPAGEVDAPVEGENPTASPKDNPDDPYWLAPHPYEDDPNVEGTTCFCGQEAEGEIHTVASEVPESTDADPSPDEMPALSADAGAPVGGELPTGTQRFRIPVVVPEEKFSGDGRKFQAGSLSSRDVPLALMWQVASDEGHKQSVIVGRIDHVEQVEGTGLGNAFGVFDDGPHGQEALRLVRAGMLRGISADLDMFEADVMPGEGDENKVTATKMNITSARLMGVTLVAKPAFAECTIELVDGEDPEVSDGIYTERTNDAVVAALVAAAAPLHPPKAWFTNPGLEKPTHLTVTDDGRVFGHIAAWDVHHIGLPYGTRPPKSPTNYSYFRTGALRTAEGEDVRVGQLTLWGGHAPLQADARTAVQHYDETKSAVADLAAGEDRHGIWVSGALRPGVTPEQVRALRASSPSGDWRPIKGMLELVAVCQVNVPGFPIAQSMVAGGQVTALVAAGIMPLVHEKQERELPIRAQLDSIQSGMDFLLKEKALTAAARMAPVLDERKQALLAAASAAEARLSALVGDRQSELASRADAALERLSSFALKVMPEFEEDKHPRNDEGKFRHVLGRLKSALSGPDSGPSAAAGLNKLEDAANAEDEGDQDKANKAGADAADALQKAADDAEGEAKATLEKAVGDVREAVARLKDGAGEKDSDFASLPEELKQLLQDAVDKAEKQVNPGDPDALLQKVKAFITGTNPMSATEILNFLKRQMAQESTNKLSP